MNTLRAIVTGKLVRCTFVILIDTDIIFTDLIGSTIGIVDAPTIVHVYALTGTHVTLEPVIAITIAGTASTVHTFAVLANFAFIAVTICSTGRWEASAVLTREGRIFARVLFITLVARVTKLVTGLVAAIGTYWVEPIA